MFEYLLGIFWALAYVFIAAGGFRFRNEKRIFMPLLSGGLNLAWEVNALRASAGLWVHLLWLLLDLVILYQNCRFLPTARRRSVYLAYVGASVILLYGVFSLSSVRGMLLSSFVIDLIMACEYLSVIKKLSPRFLAGIGVLRLLGDLFAWIANMQASLFVKIIGIPVLLLNVFYVCCALELQAQTGKRKPRAKRK